MKNLRLTRSQGKSVSPKHKKDIHQSKKITQLLPERNHGRRFKTKKERAKRLRVCPHEILGIVHKFNCNSFQPFEIFKCTL